MPWVVGIDEAGYGPNLGPLVQAAVALYLPDGDPAGWDFLNSFVRRAHEKADRRLLVDDSKKVYTRGGVGALEESLLALWWSPADVADFARRTLLPDSQQALAGEAWYTPTESLPVVAGRDAVANAVKWYGYERQTWPDIDFRFGPLRANVVPAPRFNRMVDEYGSKGTILGRGLVDLLGAVMLELPADDVPLVVACDKHGGRNFYTGILQEAFPEGWVIAERESAEESRYRVECLPREVTVTFRPRADADSVAVALASMLCKYLREVCMRQFNRFWATHVPGITLTAGYPVDAKRFYDQIQPAMAKLGLTADQVWRKK